MQRIEAILVNAMVLVLQTVNIQQLIKSSHVFNIPSLTLCNSRGRSQMFAFPYSISSIVPLAALRAEEPNSHCLRDALLEGWTWERDEQGEAVVSGGWGVQGLEHSAPLPA